MRVRLPKLRGKCAEYTILHCRVRYSKNNNIVVTGEEHSTPLYCATDSGMAWPLLGLWYHVGARGSLVEAGALA
jgi:hypothetical protein